MLKIKISSRVISTLILTVLFYSMSNSQNIALNYYNTGTGKATIGLLNVGIVYRLK